MPGLLWEDRQLPRHKANQANLITFIDLSEPIRTKATKDVYRRLQEKLQISEAKNDRNWPLIAINANQDVL